MHGAIVILPKRGVPYPFPKPDREEIIVLGIKILFNYYIQRVYIYIYICKVVCI